MGQGCERLSALDKLARQRHLFYLQNIHEDHSKSIK